MTDRNIPSNPMRLEPNGGNFYRPHTLQIHSGRFWRCKHGVAGWNDCWRCALSNIGGFLRWKGWFRWSR